MIEKLMSEMTLREKIGQTAIPNPANTVEIKKHGSLANYLKKYEFGGVFTHGDIVVDDKGRKLNTPEESAKFYKEISDQMKIPLLVTCDCEKGAKGLFDDLHVVSYNMMVGAARDKELTYKRSYYYAKELKSCGVNWQFGPVLDLLTNFFSSSGIRCISDDPDLIAELAPYIVKGFHEAGIAGCAKHFPGSAGKEYRDSHISNCDNTGTLEDWNKICKKVWQSAIDGGVDTFMVGHKTFSAVEPGYASGKNRIPSSASKNVIDLLRNDLNFDGVVVTDDCGMKSLSSNYSIEDIYINCFNAGNDIILFCRENYVDVMEKAVLDGRVSEEKLNKSVERILKLKQKLGLLDGVNIEPALTEEEKAEFDKVNYEIAKKGISLVTNHDNVIPFNPDKVKKVAVITISSDDTFIDRAQALADAFGEYGAETVFFEGLESKEQLEEISAEYDVIIYACYLRAGFRSIQFFSRNEDITTLFHGLSSGLEKTVVASFSNPSIYYNYFENIATYANAYSSDAGTMKAFVDGIMGKFEFVGESPVAMKPEFK